MTTTTALQRAVDLASITRHAAACEVSPAAFRKWLTKNGLPMSDLTGETDYSTRIEWEIVKHGGEFDGLDLIRERLPDMKPGTVYRLPLELFTNDTNQPRKQFDQGKLVALARTLGHDGQETPIKVTVDPCADIDGMRPLIITHGERRWRAAHIAQLTHLDCMLDTKAADESATDKIFRQAADNTGEQLSKWDWACTIRDLSEQHGMSDQEISDALGRRGFEGFSRPVVANLRRLFKLPDDAQKLIECGWLTPSHGKYLLAIKHEPVLRAYIRTLTAKWLNEGSPPTIQLMDADVRDHYATLYPGWIGDDEKDEPQAGTATTREEAAPPISEAAQTPAPTQTPNHTEHAASANAQREMLIDRTRRLRQAVMNSDRDTHLAILCMSAFCEDNPPLTIQQAVDRLALHPDEFIQAAAYTVLDYLDPQRLADLRQHLDVPDVPRETDQADLLEAV